MRTIAHLPLKGDNYPIAWKKLRDTYDKPCYQLNLLLDKLAELQPIKVLNADSLDSRVKAIHLTFFAMRKLTQSDTDLIEALMCHRLLQTLDMETRKLWEEQLAYRESQTGSVRTETGARAYISDANGECIPFRALLDQGSQASFITETMAQTLLLLRRRVHIPLCGIGAVKARTVRAVMSVTLHSQYNKFFQLNCELLILPKLTGLLPPTGVHIVRHNFYDNLDLANLHYHESAKIDVLLGATVYNAVICSGVMRRPDTGLIAQETLLGWIVSGAAESSRSWRAEHINSKTTIAMLCVAEEELRQALQRLWTLEEIEGVTSRLSPEDEKCEEIFKTGHSRNEEGRYTVRLPFVCEPTETAQVTKLIAQRSLAALERRLSHNLRLKEEYFRFMHTYELMGHMERIPREELPIARGWYLPHHAVVQEKPTWKIRVVFDASRKTMDRHSLNHFLMSGPPLQNDLTLILTNWRRYLYVYCTDIVKMFRQIILHKDDRDFQRIIWYQKDGGPPIEYRLTTVTYGMCCAPYLAIRTLHQLVEDKGARFPRGARCLRYQAFVDDIFGGADHLKEARDERDELISLLRTAGFKLDKWSANHQLLIPEGLRMQKQANDMVNIEYPDTVSALGLQWNQSSDQFGYNKERLEQNPVCSKRTALSCLSKLFDPLGWLSPVTIVGKILLQDLWIAKVDWDEELNEPQAREWRDFHNSLHCLSNIKIDRWLRFTPGSKVELHGFADASVRAYAAVVYARSISEDETVHVNIIAAKAKLSPIKTVCIPNLELCGATLLVRLLSHLRKLDFLKELPVTAWSDSQITLSWIKEHPSKWKQFVANRASYIQTQLPEARWCHVPSKQNPADLATRGLRAGELSQTQLWWRGPFWLSQEREHWPDQRQPTVDMDNLAQAFSLQEADPEMESEGNVLLERFSTLNRAVRVTAQCFRFMENLRRRRQEETIVCSHLTVDELTKARHALIKCSQRIDFFKDIQALHRDGVVSKNSRLRRLNPYLDQDGLLRINGRLRHSNLLHDAKYPPILSKNSNLSTLYVRHAHQDCWHGGISLTLSTLRAHVWVIDGANLVRKVVRNCTKCGRFRSLPMSQQMGNLPAPRVNLSRPFSDSGVDYASPISLRRSSGRGQSACKGYIALFICLATKAVHLEAVGDLSTEAFLGAFRRFVRHRGVCKTLYSDNGTNFRGADVELRKMYNEYSIFYHAVAEHLASRGTDWKFIPPRAPHFGGLWEAGVKNMKKHLIKVVGDHRLTFEELSTALVQIEACMNSRPLYPLSGDPADLEALTPAHFLTGSTSTLIPEPNAPDVPENRLSRYQLLQRIKTHYWKRWSHEYLTTLQERNKWQRDASNVKVGQLVAIKKDGLPPTKWALARILEVHPGSDNRVRVVILKTQSSTIKRPIVKLVPLVDTVNQDA
ncbi:uncharacterized protein [Cardiocondyla obscurior]|uniref:uncharacterized protein n=1 Tax=Cardiocondyla obscurior TaxID=286306 RepID=UPI00396577C1